MISLMIVYLFSIIEKLYLIYSCCVGTDILTVTVIMRLQTIFKLLLLTSFGHIGYKIISNVAITATLRLRDELP